MQLNEKNKIFSIFSYIIINFVFTGQIFCLKLKKKNLKSKKRSLIKKIKYHLIF
jgi:hypothetical protein